MSCRQNRDRAARAAAKNGVSQNRLTRIVIQSPAKEAVVKIEQHGQPLKGRAAVRIDGPSRVVSSENKVWIETRAPVKRLLDDLKQSKPKERTPAQTKARAAYIKAFHQAIRQRRKVSVRYQSPQGMRKFTFIPLDVKGGRTARSRKQRYMWGYFERGERVICLRLDRVREVKALADSSFDPGALKKMWQGKEIKWNLPREWS